MASSFSIVTDYSHIPLYSPDFQLISTALQAKQTKLDTNRQKLQQARDAFGALDVAKTEDQDYLEQRLQQVSDISNKYAGGDLSNDGLTNNLINSMSQVLDDNVKSALVGTKILRNEQSEWADKRKNDPKLYSDSNYAYAMQNANAWMNDKQTGTAYNGGGGFFEYVDTSKLLMDNIPALEKALHSTWQETVPGQGAFVVTETKEKVDRGRMQDALNLLINDKARKQMHVDAWAKYDNMPDEMIQQDWENHFNAKLEQNQDYLAALKAKEAEAGPQEKAMYSEAIKGWESRVNEMESTTDFNKAVNVYGKKGAYTMLADDKFTTSFLDAYTYDARTISSDVGAVQRAEADYNLKQESLEETKAHHRTLEATAASQLALTKKELSSDPYKGPDTKIIPKEGFSAATEEYYKNTANLKYSVEGYIAKQVFGKGAGETTESERNSINAIMRSPDFARKLAATDFVGAKSINIKGTDISFAQHPWLRSKLIDYQEEFLTTSKTKLKAFVPLEESAKEARATLYQAIARGQTDKNEMPVYNMHHVKVGGETTIVAGKATDKNPNNYLTLLRKEHAGTLSPLEVKDLQLYTNIHMANDKKLKPYERAIMYEKITSDLKEVDAKGYKLAIGISKRGLKDSNYSDMHLSDITTGDVYERSISGQFFKGENSKEELDNQMYNLYRELQHPPKLDFLARDKAVILQDIKNVKLKQENLSKEHTKGINTIMSDGFKQVNTILESHYVEEKALPRSSTGVYSKSNKGQLETWNKLVAKLNEEGGDTSGSLDVTIKPLINKETNLPTGNAIITQQSGKKGVAPYTKIISAAEAREIVGGDIAYTSSKYNASHPGAKTISLGNGIYASNNNQIGFADDKYAENIRERAATYGTGGSDLANKLIENYKAGNYIVKYENNLETGFYYPVIYLKNSKGEMTTPFENVYLEPITQEFSNEDVQYFHSGAKSNVDNAIFEAIQGALTNYSKTIQ
jgi:hypothetical protein